MTSVEEAPTAEDTSFEAVYAADRGRLYRALTLATGNRDIALEGVDRAFARWQSRRRSRRVDPDLHVYASAYRWASRKLRRPGRMIQGFRLREDDPATDETLLRHFDELALEDRSLLTCLHYLNWTPDRAAHAMHIPAGEALPRAGAAASRLGRNAGLSADEAAARLGSALHERAATLAEPLSRADAVETQARWRRIGILALGSVGAVVVIAAVAFGVDQVTGDEEPGGQPEAAANQPSAETAGSGIFTADVLAWERVPIGVTEGDLTAVAYGPAGFVAVGQEWSGAGRSIAMVSEDGVFWEPSPGPTEGPNSWVHQVTAAGDRYIAVGNRFDEVRGGDAPLISVSTDGTTWTTIPLPVENQMEFAGQLVTLHTWIQSVAASEDRVIVMANQNAEFDFEPLLQEALGDEFNFDQGWGWSDQGIEVWSDEGNLQQRIPWEETGLDPGLVQMMNRGRPQLFSSTDLETWESIPFEGFGSNQWVSNMAVVGDSFVAVVYGDFGSELWTSANGSDWTLGAGFDPGVSINDMAAFGDQVIAIGTDVDGASTAWVTSDLEEWEAVPLPFQNGWLQRIQVSSTGIAVLGEEQARPQGPVEIVVDDLTVQITDRGGYTVLDAEGDEIARIPGRDVRHNDMTIELYDPETDELLVVLDQREVDQQWELIWRQFEVERGNAGPNYVLLLSEDGKRWTSHSIADSIGGGFYPNAIAIGPDSVVMTGHQDQTFLGDVFGGGGSGLAVWVGTAG